MDVVEVAVAYTSIECLDLNALSPTRVAGKFIEFKIASFLEDGKSFDGYPCLLCKCFYLHGCCYKNCQINYSYHGMISFKQLIALSARG